jgi:hypothetical protein
MTVILEFSQPVLIAHIQKEDGFGQVQVAYTVIVRGVSTAIWAQAALEHIRINLNRSLLEHIEYAFGQHQSQAISGT